ncbi:MAG TPA: hypothetical protein VHE30_01630 [Polyangiaceae bacterium]|nr:hypothetical protein [Polyangiaceae bacterium]
MSSFARLPAWIALVATLARPAGATERDVARGLADAERAYQGVDFDAAYAKASAALSAGGGTREQVARLAVLLGTSAAALGKEDEARKAFLIALAIAPEEKLDQTLSPKIRSPYLEAQGFFRSRTDRLTLDVHPSREGDRISVRVVDPATLLSRLVLHVKPEGESTYRELPAPADATARFRVPDDARDRGFSYFVTGLDAHDNVLVSVGSEDDPVRIRRESAPTKPGPRLHPTTPVVDSGRSYVLPVTFAVLGVGAAATGAVFHVKREQAAATWNGTGCERPGATRIAQCGMVDDARRKDETAAIVSYAAAGALLGASLVTLVAFGPANREAAPESARASCGVTGSAVLCSGSF